MPAELLRAVEQSCGCAIWSQPESIKEQVRTSCTCRPEHLGDAIVIQRDSRPGRTGEESGPCCRNRCSRWPDTLQSRMVHLSPCPTPEARLTQQRWASNSRKGHWPFPGGGRGGVMVSPGGFRHAQKPLSVSSCPSRALSCCPPGPLSEDAQLRENAVSPWRPADHGFKLVSRTRPFMLSSSP